MLQKRGAKYESKVPTLADTTTPGEVPASQQISPATQLPQLPPMENETTELESVKSNNSTLNHPPNIPKIQHQI